MTVPATTRKAGPYAGNGVATQFPFAFKVFDKSDVGVFFTDSDGFTTQLTLDSDYSVTLAADQDVNPGGAVTYPLSGTPLDSASRLTILGSLVAKQMTDLTNGSRFLPQVQENAFDYLTILIQQLEEAMARTLRASPGTNLNLQFPAPSSAKFLRWRSDLTGLENADAGTDSMVLQGMLADQNLPSRGAAMVAFAQSLAYPAGSIGNAIKLRPLTADLGSTTDASKGSALLGYKLAATGSVGRSLADKLRDVVSVLDFGADASGSADSSGAFNNALAASKRVLVPDGTYRIAGVTVPLGGSLELSQGSVLRPAAAGSNMLRLKAGATLRGGLIDTSNLTFTATAIDINGDDQATSGFALHVETNIETTLKGGFGTGKGTAIYLHADGLATARIMGVNARVRIYGFTFGVRMRQTSTDGSRFVNGNRIDAWCSECWQALDMDTPSGQVHLDGNIIRIQHQPWIGTTASSANIAGQYNQIYIAPWDWDGVVGTSPYAVVLLPGARYNDLDMIQTNGYLQNNSGNTLNSIKTITHQYVERVMNLSQRFFPPYPGNFPQSNCSIYAGGGAPPFAEGVNGDIYINSGGGAGTTIYQKRGGSWVGIV